VGPDCAGSNSVGPDCAGSDSVGPDCAGPDYTCTTGMIVAGIPAA
jgi:hypothetical protein